MTTRRRSSSLQTAATTPVFSGAFDLPTVPGAAGTSTVTVEGAFQADAFQNDAFQIAVFGVGGGGTGIALDVESGGGSRVRDFDGRSTTHARRF